MSAIQLNVSIPKDIYDHLAELAGRIGRSKKEVVVKALETYLAITEEKEAFQAKTNAGRVKAKVYFEAADGQENLAAVLLY